MDDDVFAAPRSESSGRDEGIRARARRELYVAGSTAIGLGVFQVFCNPCFTMTIFAAVAAVAAIQRPDRLRFAVGDNYPDDAGGLCQVLGYVTLGLCGLRILIDIALFAVMFGSA